MWIIIFASVFVAGVGGIIYLIKAFQRFSFMKKLSEKNKIAALVISIAAISVIGGVWLIINGMTMLLVLIHLFIFWIICDIAAFVIKKLCGKSSGKYYAGAAAFLITAVYLTIGWYLAHHISITRYSFETDKELSGGELRIALIADSHLGITLDGEKFEKQVERIAAESPDMVVIAGDFVDDKSTSADMKAACKALGELDTKYGVFYSFGNHDKAYYGTRDFDEDDLRNELTKNNIVILEDENKMLAENICVIGRQDAMEADRMTIGELSGKADRSDYKIVIDHQPTDYENEALAGVDLVLSGHTHGGHIFPVGPLSYILGINDHIYGTKRCQDTDFVVTSGISGWEMPFKTFARSEIVIIEVKATPHKADLT